MTNIMLCGCMGHMGKVITNIVSKTEKAQIVAGVDISKDIQSDFPIFSVPSDFEEKADVIIDFSHPSALNGILDYAIKTNTPAVICTTGLNDSDINKIKEASKRVAIFFSFNMSIGINLICNLAKIATAILSDNFDIEIIEKHHNQKLDAPSGTAIMIANEINSTLNNEYELIYDRHLRREKRPKKEIGISSLRGGTIVGEHEVIFAGNSEEISLKHVASSKDVFAWGAVKAALWIKNKDAGLYDMGDLVKEM